MFTRSPLTIASSAVAVLGIVASVTTGVQVSSKNHQLAERQVALSASQSALSASQAQAEKTTQSLTQSRAEVSNLTRSVASAERETTYVTQKYVTQKNAAKASAAEATRARYELSVSAQTVRQLRTCAAGLAGVGLSILDEDYEKANAQLDAIDASCKNGAAGAKAANGGV